MTLRLHGWYSTKIAGVQPPGRLVRIGLALGILAAVQLACGGAAPPFCGGSIKYGEEEQARISRGADCRFEFTGKAGDVVTIRMDALDPQLDPYLELVAPSGTDASGRLLASNDDRQAGDSNSTIADFPLPADGEYTIVASSYEDRTAGRFLLKLCTPETCS